MNAFIPDDTCEESPSDYCHRGPVMTALPANATAHFVADIEGLNLQPGDAPFALLLGVTLGSQHHRYTGLVRLIGPLTRQRCFLPQLLSLEQVEDVRPTGA